MISRLREFEIYIPLVKKKGARVAGRVISEIKRFVIDQFEGYTVLTSNGEGGWAKGRYVVKDRIMVFKVLSAEKGLKKMKALQKFLAEKLDQEEILITVRSISTV